MSLNCWPFYPKPKLPAVVVTVPGVRRISRAARRLTVWKTIVCVTIGIPLAALPPLVWWETPYPLPPHTSWGPVTPWGYPAPGPANIPEPATMLLLGGVFVGLAGIKRLTRKRRGR